MNREPVSVTVDRQRTVQVDRTTITPYRSDGLGRQRWGIAAAILYGDGKKKVDEDDRLFANAKWLIDSYRLNSSRILPTRRWTRTIWPDISSHWEAAGERGSDIRLSERLRAADVEEVSEAVFISSTDCDYTSAESTTASYRPSTKDFPTDSRGRQGHAV